MKQAESPQSSETRFDREKNSRAKSKLVLQWVTTAREGMSGLGKHARILLFIIASIFAVVVLFWILDKLIFFYLVSSYVDGIAEVFDVNKHLAKAFVLIVFLAVVVFGSLLWSFSKRKRRLGIAGLASLLAAHSLILWLGTREKFFDRSGAAIKCYVVTRDGTVTYGEQPGIHQVTGRQCRPVTPEMVERLREYEKGKLPQRISSSDPTFFAPRTGEPIVWFYQSTQNGIELFD